MHLARQRRTTRTMATALRLPKHPLQTNLVAGVIITRRIQHHTIPLLVCLTSAPLRLCGRIPISLFSPVAERHYTLQIRIIRHRRIQQPQRPEPILSRHRVRPQILTILARPHWRDEPIPPPGHRRLPKIRPPNLRPQACPAAWRARLGQAVLGACQLPPANCQLTNNIFAPKKYFPRGVDSPLTRF